MSKHTPGPWYAKEWSAKDDDGAPLCGGWNIIDRMEVRIPLSDMEGDIDEAEANALLIAAAPDLLEALQSILDMCNEDSHARDYASRQTEIRGTAIVALRKAQGDQDGTR